jgi:PAS domain S-box-containing protein
VTEKGRKATGERKGGAKRAPLKRVAAKRPPASRPRGHDRMFLAVEPAFRSMLQDMKVVFFATDAEGRLTSVSPSVEQVAGYLPEEVTARHFSDFIHPQDLPNIQLQFKMLSRGLPQSNEYRIMTKTGRSRWVFSSGRPVFDARKSFTGTVGMLIDVQRSRSAEEAFRETDEQFRNTFDLAAVGIAHLSPDWTWLRVNETLCEIVGYGSDELQPMQFSEITHPADRAADAAALEGLSEGRVQTVTREKRILRKDGFTVSVSSTVAAVHDAAGRIKYYIAIIEDVTGRKRMEDTLQMLRTAVGSIPLGVTITNLDSRIIYVNPAEARMHGYTPDELLGREARVLSGAGAGSGGNLRDLFAGGRIGDVPYTRERWDLRKDGTKFPVELRSVPARDLRGTPLGFITVAEDVSERKQMIDALKESELKYRNLVDNSLIGVFRSTLGGTLLYVNESHARMTGFASPAEMMSVPVPSLYKDPADRERMVTLLKQDGQVNNFEFEHLKKDGSSMTVLISAVLDGTVISGMMMDISERKRFEQALKESEARFRETADLLPQPVFEAGLDGRVSFANRSAYTQFGYEPRDVSDGLNVFDMLVPGDREGAQEYVVRLLQGGPQIGNEYTALRRDGSTFPVVIYSAPALRGNAPAGIRGVVLDITERKRTEEMLGLAKKDWESTFDTITDMITIHDADFNIVRANRAAAEILGLPWFAMGRAKCYEQYHGTDCPPPGCPSCESLRTGQPSVQERYEPHLNKYLEIRAIPRKDDEGRIVGLIHVVRDISERKKTEAEKTALEARLVEAQRMETIGSLAGGVAHEVRNPLNAIMALTDALDREIGADPEYRAFMQHMRNQVERLSTLMTDLLELGKPVDQAQLHAESLPEICALSVDAWKQSKGGQGREVVTSLCPPGGGSAASVLADAKKLQQVIINLLDNAAQHSPEDSPIAIEIMPSEGGWVEVRVVDRGKGIAADLLPRVFDAFFTTRRGGTGLGLSIVKHIVEKHGGAVAIANNAVPPGCTASVVLPALQENP